jgi:hypothetical protein
VTGYGPPDDDPSEAPTGYIDYDGATAQGDPRRGQPWYRRPIISLSIGLFLAILLGLVIYLLADRTSGSGTLKQTPTSPTTSAVTTTTTPPASTETTTEPVAPAPTPTETYPTTTVAPTTTAPVTTPPTSTSIDDGHHHHHHHDGETP